jgi:hypothetical protein
MEQIDAELLDFREARFERSQLRASGGQGWCVWTCRNP